jgi:hypothetical protein
MDKMISESIDKTVSRVDRVLYDFAGNTELEDGALQLSFQEGGVLFLDGGADGESLIVKNCEWVDPFMNAQTQDNREYIERHGKWSLHDVSGTDPFCRLVDKRLDAVKKVYNDNGILCGVGMRFESEWVFFIVAADMSVVVDSHRIKELQGFGYKVNNAFGCSNS